MKEKEMPVNDLTYQLDLIYNKKQSSFNYKPLNTTILNEGDAISLNKNSDIKEFLSLKLEAVGDYYLSEEEMKEIVLDTNITDRISILIKEICKCLEIDNENDFDFFILSYGPFSSYNTEIFNLIFFFKFRIDKIFEKFDFKVYQKIRIKISSKQVRPLKPSNFLQGKTKEIHSRMEMLNYLKNASKINRNYSIKENLTFIFDKFLYYSINHFLDENQIKNFNLKENFKISKKSNFKLKRKYSNIEIFPVLKYTDFAEQLSKMEKSYIKINNLHLVIRNLKEDTSDLSINEINSLKIVEINFLKISFLNSDDDAIENFILSLNKFKICANNLKLKFSKNSKLKFSQFLKLLNIIHSSEHQNTNLHLKFHLIEHKDIYDLDDFKKIKLISLHINDELKTISQNLQEVFENFISKFDLEDFAHLELKNLKISSRNSIEAFFKFLSKVGRGSLRKLILLNNKIQLPDRDNKYYLYLDKLNGLRINNCNECKLINRQSNINHFEIQNTKILKLSANDLEVFNFFNQNFKFDKNSVLFDRNFPYEKFQKQKAGSKIIIHPKIMHYYYNRMFSLPDNVTKLTINNLTSSEEIIKYLFIHKNSTRDGSISHLENIESEQKNLYYEGILLKEKVKNLRNLKILNLYRSYELDNRKCDKIQFDLKQIHSLHLNSYKFDKIDLLSFLKHFRVLEELTIGDLFIEYNKTNFNYDNKIFINTLILNLNNLKEIAITNTPYSLKESISEIDTFVNISIKNLLDLIDNYFNLKNLIFSNDTFELLKEFSSKYKTYEFYSFKKLKNLIFYDVDIGTYNKSNDFKKFDDESDSFLDLILSSLDNLCIFNSNLNFHTKLKNFLSSSKKFYDFSKLRIDYTSILKHLTFRTTLSSVESILNAFEIFSYSDNKDAPQSELINQIKENLNFLNVLRILGRKKKEIYIYYKSSKEFNELILMFEISYRILNVGVNSLKTEIKSFLENIEWDILNRTNSMIVLKEDLSRLSEKIRMIKENKLRRINFFKIKKINKIMKKVLQETNNLT